MAKLHLPLELRHSSSPFQ